MAFDTHALALSEWLSSSTGTVNDLRGRSGPGSDGEPRMLNVSTAFFSAARKYRSSAPSNQDAGGATLISASEFGDNTASPPTRSPMAPVYFVSPRAIAWIAASQMCAGVGKSGSPISR